MARAEIILLQFDIAGHSRINISPKNLQQARKLLQKYISSLVAVQRDTPVSWAGDGGWCWFKVTESADFSMATDAAVDILGMVPRINEILLRDNVIEEPLAIRLSADTMNVELDEDPSHFCAPQMNKFLKHERDIGLVNSLVITQRIFDHFQPHFRKRFNRWRYSQELETELFVYDGARIRNDKLRGLNNRGPHSEELTPQLLQITTFERDSYHDLCNHAYADVILDIEIPNVESVRFLAFRNALANCVINSLAEVDVREMRRHYETESDFELAVAAAPYETLHSTHFHRPRDREYFEHLNPLASAIEWSSHERVFKGGEDVRFFNAAALGFITEIGEGTLLDHAVADSLRIRSVIGGVEPSDRTG